MRRILLVLVILVLVGAAGAGGYVIADRGSSSDDTAATTTGTTPSTTRAPAPKDLAREAIDRFTTAWSAGKDAQAADMTNRPKAAATALAENRKGLDGASLVVKTLSFDDTAKRNATARLRLTWTVAGYGPWTYKTTAQLRQIAGGQWVLLWQPAIVWPGLTSKTRLGTDRIQAPRAPILDRDGKALVTMRPVVQIGLERDKVKNVAASAKAMAKLAGIDVAAYTRQVKGAGRIQFVVAETLRTSDYQKIQKKLKAIPGAIASTQTQSLAPTPGFARALLGEVAPATAQQIKDSKGRIAIGDVVGQWGLEAAYNTKLAGKEDVTIITRERATGDALRTLEVHQGRAPSALRTTISTKVQQAAESALGTSTAPSALIAIQPSSGDVLAVANRPLSSTFDRALAGAYAPGSTFKVIATTALLERGFSPATPVPCPSSITVYGRTFKNFQGESTPSSSFPTDFAISCNTAFISLASRLPATALAKTALEFGVGRNKQLPFGTADSHVPVGGDPVSHAAMMIGQERIVATPLAMAGVAGTIAAGRWHQPRLLVTDPKVAGPPIPAAALGTVRSLMRLVVTQGTGIDLAHTPGSPICKTGTAEFGGGDPPPTHAWFICARGNLAIAVLVERGKSGGTVAAPIAERFFAAYDR